MSDFKTQMIEAFERGECGYAESYDYVRERMADQADLERKRRKEDGEFRVGLPASKTKHPLIDDPVHTSEGVMPQAHADLRGEKDDGRQDS